MTDKESQAHELVRRKEWVNAIQIFDQILSPTTSNFKITNVRIIGCLFGRTECYLEIKNYDAAIGDCRRLLKMLGETEEEACSTSARIKRRLIHALYKLKRYQEAEIVCRDWLNTMWGGAQNNTGLTKVLERYRTVIQIANGQKSNQRISVQRLDEEMSTLDNKLENWATHNLHQDYYSRFAKIYPTNQNGAKKQQNSNNNSNNVSSNSSSSSSSSSGGSLTSDIQLKIKDKPHTSSGIEDGQKQMVLSEKLANISLNNGDSIDDGDITTCTYCAITFSDRTDLRAHCQTEAHQNVIMSDEGE